MGLRWSLVVVVSFFAFNDLLQKNFFSARISEFRVTLKPLFDEHDRHRGALELRPSAYVIYLVEQ